MRLLPKLLALCLLAGGAARPAFASYVMQCVLQGTVVSAPDVRRLYLQDAQGREIEREESRFRFAVHQAKPAGRADGDCRQQFAGKTIEVELNAGDQKVRAIRQDDRLSIDYLNKDNKGVKPSVTFSLRE